MLMLRSSPRPSDHRSRDAAVALAVTGLVAGFLTWGSVGAAQSPEPLAGTASLTGTVEALRPFTAARVYARNTDRRILYMVYTAGGRFRAVGLLPGSYEVNVQAPGLVSDVQHLAVGAGDHPHITVSLRDADGPDRFPSAVDAPARDLTLQSYDEIYPPGPGR
ncbi:MAG: carboxypeptidase-like regulatory domain-containing protein, partial [Acidobacteria bacterium]|nr:carboxypeptidase-like regulatory domain-containing protein [Acidobacteriota bacterium]